MTLGPRRLVLGGMGGIGKTQLSLAYAQKHHSSYKSVIWLNAASEVTIKASIRSVAERLLAISDYDQRDDQQILLFVRQWLSDPHNTQWLLIFDNYDEPDQFDIEIYCPYTIHGSIIITTRLPDRVRGSPVRIQPLQRIEDSLSILQTRSQRENISTDIYAHRLAERLGGLPLALATAGAYLRKSTFTFEQYLRDYERRWNIDPRRPLMLQEYQDRTLYTTWDLSYARLENDDPEAAQMLKLLAYFDHQNIWYELLHVGMAGSLPTWLQTAITDPVDFESVMRTLVEYCLVEVNPAEQSYSMHSCIHDWTLARLNKVIDAWQYWYAFDSVAATINKDDWESLGHLRYARLTAHAIRLIHSRFLQSSVLDSIEPDRFERASDIAQLLRRQVQFKASEQMYERALAGHEKALRPDDTSILKLIHDIGSLYHDQGKLGEAEHMYMRALAGREKALGPDDASTLSTVNSLGILYRAQGKLDEAEQMYMRALAGREKALGPDHTSTLSTINSLGVLYRAQGKLDEAEHMYRRALAGREKTWGPEHTSTLTTVNNLGNLYTDLGKLDEAERMYMRALAGKEKTLGPDHTSTLNTFHNLGSLYRDQGKLKEAEQMYMRALAGKEKALGFDHTSTLDTVNNLGNLYSDQGKLDVAEQMFLRALAGTEKALGPNHVSTLDTVNELGNLYRAQGKLDEAEHMYTRALVGQEKALGPDHTGTLKAVNNLGKLYTDQGKLDEAEQMFLRALAGREKALGLDHTSTLETVNNLGLVYADQGKTGEAEQMYLQALDRFRRSLRGASTPSQTAVSGFAAALCASIRIGNGDSSAVRPRLVELCNHVRKWGQGNKAIFSWLAKALFGVDDERNSQLAFQFAVRYHNDGVADFGGTYCNGCQRQITVSMGRRVCRRCQDVDLCKGCMSKYETNTLVLSKCRGHDFFRVDTAGLVVSQPLAKNSEVGFDAWIDTVIKQYSQPS